MIRRRAPRRRGSAGQALVEFALTVPIFLILLFGLIDGARLVFAMNTVFQATREAARLAAVQAEWIGATGAACTAPVCPASSAAFRTNVVGAANRMTAVIGTVPSGNVFIACTDKAATPPSGAWTSSDDCGTASAREQGDIVSVRTTMDVAPLTPVFRIFIPAFTFTSNATMHIE